MRRPAPLLLLLALLAAGLAGCSHSEGTVGATAETVIGTLPQQKTLPKGTAAAGKAVFASSGCGGCHTYQPAGSNASDRARPRQARPVREAGERGRRDGVHPRLDREPERVHRSRASSDLMPKDYGSKLSDKQLADLIAFLEQK